MSKLKFALFLNRLPITDYFFTVYRSLFTLFRLSHFTFRIFTLASFIIPAFQLKSLWALFTLIHSLFKL
jgi:hypothetical protein